MGAIFCNLVVFVGTDFISIWFLVLVLFRLESRSIFFVIIILLSTPYSMVRCEMTTVFDLSVEV